MAWRDNPVGIVLNDSRVADIPRLKAEGLDFIVVEAGRGPNIKSASYAQVVQAAYDNDLPILLSYAPYPAQDDITQEDNPESQIALAKSLIQYKLFHGYIVDVTRWWVGTDKEDYDAVPRRRSNIRPATNANIRYTAEKIAVWMADHIRSVGKQVNVFIGSSDPFVQAYSKDMSVFVHNFPFFANDPRYRYKDAQGAYTQVYTYQEVATPIESIAALRQEMPPVDAKNPLIPGNGTALKFWVWARNRFVHPAVKDLNGRAATASFVLFNGTKAEMHTFLGYKPRVVEPPPPDDPVKPGAPIDFEAVVSGNSVTLSWKPPAPYGTGIVAYHVYRNGTEIDVVPDLQFVDSNLAAGSYTYAVDAEDVDGNRSDKTSEKTVTIVSGPVEPPVTPEFVTRLTKAIDAFCKTWLGIN